MSLRYRRSVKIAPGVRLNFSKRGVSTSFGGRGLSVNVSKRGTYLNTGIPGTGLSSRTKLTSRSAAPSASRSVSPGGQPHLESTPAPAQNSIAPSEPLPHREHHMHWRTVLLFIGTMVLTGATKSQAAIGVFWLAWFGYWFFLLVRLIVRSSKSR